MAIDDPRGLYQKKDIAEGYDAERFHSLSGKVFDYLEKRAISKALAVVSPESSVLDIPCGTGRITELLLRSGFETVGMDLSQAMISVAQRKLESYGGRVRFQVGDLAELKISGEVFPCVTCIRFLCHFDRVDRIKFLRTLSQVSQKWVILGVGYSSPWYAFRRTLKMFCGWPKPMHFSMDEQALDSEFRESGLQIVRRFYPLRFVSEDLILLLRKIEI